jgi:transcriptional regulator GlxA family with amidase domain
MLTATTRKPARNLLPIELLHSYSKIDSIWSTLLSELASKYDVYELARLTSVSTRTLARLVQHQTKNPNFCLRYKILLLHVLTFAKRYKKICRSR